MRVHEVMTRDVLWVHPDARVKDVAALLAAERVSGVPVVDSERRVVGVVSEADIVAKAAGAQKPGGLFGWLVGPVPTAKQEARTAREAMTSPAVSIGPEQSVAEAARLMSELGINRLPVVDLQGRLTGIVSRGDLVRAFARSDEDIERELRDEVVLRSLWIDPHGLEITVEGGEVTLAGETETKADAVLLQRFATRVPGVVGVRSELTWRREDPRLERSDPRLPVPPRR